VTRDRDLRILLSETAFTAWHAAVLDVCPGAICVRLQVDGELLVDGNPVASADARAEVAWFTAEMFFVPLGRTFFTICLDSDSLRWFQSPGAGVDHPVFARLMDRGVRLTASHANSLAIAEYVLGSVLRFYQRPEDWARAQAERAWRHHQFREIWGTTWLIVGLGAIGTAVATRARSFGAHVIGVRRHPRGDEPVDALLPPAQLVDAVGLADVVVLAAPATTETHHLVDARFLAQMREGSVLVNIARGSLVDEGALLAALDRGRPAKAVLDVFATEPLPAASPLWNHPRVVITPHSSAGGLGRHARNAELFVENLGRYLDGQRLLYEVSPDEVPAAP
jgi:phosphoglycerate dehydrogenase-like enzyme